MISKIAHWAIQYRKVNIVFHLVLVGVFATGLAKLEFDTNMEIWFERDAPALKAFKRLNDSFGDHEMVLLLIEDREHGVFSPQALQTIGRLSQGLENTPHVNRVQSLITHQSIKGSSDSLLIEDLFDLKNFPPSNEQLEQIKKEVLSDSLAVGSIVNASGTVAAMVGRIDHQEGSFLYKVEVAEHLMPIIESEQLRSGYEIFVGGAPMVDYAFYFYAMQDNKTLLPILYLLVVVVLFLVFRAWRGVVFSLFVVAVTTVVTMGGIALSGVRVNGMLAMVPMLLVAVCIADAVHVVVVFYEKLRYGGNRKHAAIEAIEDIFVPCFLTSVTTAIGFASLSLSPMPPLLYYGLFCSAGVLAAFEVSIVFLPGLLSIGRDYDVETGEAKGLGRVTSGGMTLAFLRSMKSLAKQYPRAVVGWCTAATVVFLAGALLLKTETVVIEFFRESSPVRYHADAIQERLGGVTNLELFIDSGEEDAVKNPRLLRDVEKVQQYLDSIPEVSKTVSVVDFIKRMNQALNGEDPAFYRVPDDRSYVAQLLLLYSLSDPTEDLSDLVDYPYQLTRVTARVPYLSSQRNLEIVEDLDDFMKRETPSLDATLTGMIALFNGMGVSIYETLKTSFLMTVVTITLVIGLAFRSVRTALLSLVPNVLPIVWVLGLMGYARIRLDVGTVMVAGIAIGIAVDDSIHFLSRYSKARRRGLDVDGAIDYVIQHSGRAIVFTSVILTGGFWMLTFAQFLPMAYFGLIAGVTIVIALLADVLLLPAILYLNQPMLESKTSSSRDSEGMAA